MSILFWIAGLSFALIITGLGSVNSYLLILALPLFFFLAAGIYFAPAKPELQIKRLVEPERVGANDPIAVKLSITNLGSHLEEVILEDLVPANLKVLEGETSMLLELSPGQEVELCYVVAGGRGIFRFSGLRVTAHDRLGIIRRRRVLPTSGQVFILPDMPKLKHVGIRPRGTRVYSGVIPARQGGVGVEFYGVRNYIPGDSLRYINWRASARFPHGLYSNQFQLERVTDVWLILDARTRSDVQTASGSLFEHGVLAGAGLARALLSEGNRLGLLVYGGYLDWTYPAYGKVQLERVLRALARAKTGESLVFEGLEHLPTRLFPLDSQLILVSPLQREDEPVLTRLRARGYQVVVISPDSIAFETSIQSSDRHDELGRRTARLERNLLLAQLRQSGIQVLSWDVSQPFDRALQAQLRRLQHWSHLQGVRL